LYETGRIFTIMIYLFIYIRSLDLEYQIISAVSLATTHGSTYHCRKK